MRIQTDGSHQKKVARALLYIQERLDGPLRLDEVAETVCSAPSHFHAIFRNVTGQPLQGYVRQTRLHWAAYRLLFDQQPIISIALDAGYDSHEAFSRVFRKMFHVSPSDYRKNARPARLIQKPTATKADACPKTAIEYFEQTLPNGKLVYSSYFGPYEGRHRAWQNIGTWLEHSDVACKVIRAIGVTHDIPDANGDRDIRYDAGVLFGSVSVTPPAGLGVQWLDSLSVLSADHYNNWLLSHNTFIRLANHSMVSCPEHDRLPVDRTGLLPYYELFDGVPLKEPTGKCTVCVAVPGRNTPSEGPFAALRQIPSSKDTMS